MKLFFLFIAIMSLIAFISYGIDKRRAVKHRYRLPESVLLFLAVIGGAPGALLGMKIFHHKTAKPRFWVVNLFSIAVFIALFLYFFFPCK